jgi:hypothetical protein
LKIDFPVHVCDSEMAGMGLFGQTFYNDHQYTIDYERGLIHFVALNSAAAHLLI